MKAKITKTITPAVTEEVEVEIALPFFSKDSNGIYFMICPDESVITVINFASGKESKIQRDKNMTPSWLNEAVNGIAITREEFFGQYEKALNFIEDFQFIIPEREEVEQHETSNI